MVDNIQKRTSNRKICVDDLIDAFVCYRVLRDEDGQPIDAVIIDANAENERIIGKNCEELIGVSISQLLSRESMIKWIELYKAMSSDSKMGSYSFYSEFAGRMFNTKIFIDEDGHVNVIYHDTSELHSVNVRYSQAEEKYRAIVEASPDIILRFDPSCRHIFTNNAVEKATGIKKEAFIGKTHRELGFPENLCDYWEIRIKKVFDSKENVREIFQYGDIIWDWYLVPEFDGNHKVQAVLSISRDITERTVSEEMLHESEGKYRNLVEQSINGIMAIDSHGIITEFNTSMENITGLRREQAVGHFLGALYFGMIPKKNKSSAEYREVKTAIRKFLESGYLDTDGKMFEGVIQRPDGAIRNIEYVSYKFKVKDSIHTSFIIRDVTELKRAEELKRISEESEKKLKEALELDRLRTEFFTNLSHELRTPLNIIFSSVQLISKDISDKADLLDKGALLSNNLKVAKQNCYRLLRLINNLIDVTKIDAGFYDIHPVSCDIIKVVEDITLLISEYTKSRNLSLVFDTDTEEKAIICDPDKVERIMLNLLSNAIKFSNEGGSVYVNISDGEEYVTISVEDTGIGIPADKLEYVFERFRQVDNSLTRAYEGSGIGLSLVKSLIEMHGGTIAIMSILGKGTKFIIRLPINVLTPEDKEILNRHNIFQDNNIQKVSIEFSDLYL